VAAVNILWSKEPFDLSLKLFGVLQSHRCR